MRLLPVLIQAMKEQQALIEQLTLRVAALEAKKTKNTTQHKMHKQTLGGCIYSGLQKGLHVGQKAVEYTALAKGIYDTGKTLFSIGRLVGPAVAAML